MPHFKCLVCNTRFYSTESEADSIGDLCPVCGSLLEPVGELGEIGGYRVVESPGSASRSGASGAGQLIAERVGEIISLDASSSTHEFGSKSKAATLTLSAHERKPSAFAFSGSGGEAVRRRRAPTTAGPPRLPRVLGAFDAGRRRRARRRQRGRFALRFGRRAAQRRGRV
jgi:hypothetical protein